MDNEKAPDSEEFAEWETDYKKLAGGNGGFLELLDNARKLKGN